jgi:hypothetical protein
MADTVISQNIDLSSWDIQYIFQYLYMYTLHMKINCWRSYDANAILIQNSN